jgi:hypothetical protein
MRQSLGSVRLYLSLVSCLSWRHKQTYPENQVTRSSISAIQVPWYSNNEEVSRVFCYFF